MAEILDASAIDDLNEFELTGEIDDFEDPDQEPVLEPENQEDLPLDQNTETTPQEEPGQPEEAPELQDIDFTTEVLRLKGISDPTKIKFEDESGAVIERNWDDLSEVEKLNILAAEGDPERDLEEDEILFINLVRESQMPLGQYIQLLQQQAAQQAIENYTLAQAPIYEIDSLTDDELFALDLLEKVGEENITDEELQEALEAAKANETLFAKQIEGLRTAYKNLEDQQKYDAEQAQFLQAEQQYQEFTNKVLNEIDSFNSFANQEIELSTDDKNDIANYLLTRRDTGISDFYADMQDPATATLAAFWLLRGPEVLNEMETQILEAYKRGFAMGKAKPSTSVTPKTPLVVVQLQKPATSSKVDLQSAFGLEDDSYLS